jgi:membrane protein insertase Oxa1/YidC/SpoIIIJ
MLSNILLNPLPLPRPHPGAQNMPAPIKFFLTRYAPMQKFTMALACAFGYIMQEMPAAIALYVFSSVVTGFVQRRWLNLSMPLRKPILPCARGTRVRSKKEWSAKA